MLGRLSEEFGGALPSVIWAEQQRLPAGLLEEIVEARAFAAAWRANAADPERWQTSALRILAKTIEHELVLESTDDDDAE